MTYDEGYIKFNCKWIKAKPIPLSRIKELNKWRDKLYKLGLIGVYEDGIGFGNLSTRIKNTNKFIVSGTQTGGLKKLTGKHYTEVIQGNFQKNSLVCKGPIKASSESLTHLSIYQVDPNIAAVIHVHHPKYWKKLLNRVPTTDKNVPYGTPEMADEVQRLFKETNVKKERVFVMAGHEEGIIAFGETLTKAGRVLSAAIKAIN